MDETAFLSAYNLDNQTIYFLREDVLFREIEIIKYKNKGDKTDE